MSGWKNEAAADARHGSRSETRPGGGVNSTVVDALHGSSIGGRAQVEARRQMRHRAARAATDRNAAERDAAQLRELQRAERSAANERVETQCG